MIGSSAFCCFPVDIAVRLIGSITLLTNVFVFIALVSHRDEVFADDKIRIVFGFDSQFFNSDNRSLDDAVFQEYPSNLNCSGGSIFYNLGIFSKKLPAILQFGVNTFFRDFSVLFAEWFPIFCPIFALVDAVASALLIWASITVQRWLTVPWLFCSIFNVVCHVTSLTMLSFRRLPPSNEWITALTVFYAVALLYFTLIVTIAHYLWWIHSRESDESPGNQELWENVYKSPPLFEGPYKDQV